MIESSAHIRIGAGKAVRLAALAGLFCIFLLAIWLRYRNWMFPVLYGDDLTYYVAFLAKSCATAPADILISVCQERFRPVASGTVIALMHLFGSKMLGYQIVNGLILASVGVMTFAIARRLAAGVGITAFLVALAVVVSRFATYHATQMIAPVESLAILSALGSLYAVLRAEASAKHAWRWCWTGIAFAFVAIHTHERFAVLSAWLFGAFLLTPAVRALKPARFIVLLAGCALVPIFYIAYKRLALDTVFLVGTGGSYIDFDIPRIAGFARDALLSIAGFNTGPQYLVGTAVTPGLNAMFLVACVLFGTWLVLVVAAIVCQIRGVPAVSRIGRAWRLVEQIRWPILLLSLAAFLLFPTLLTIHLEHRWLYAPFTILMLLAAWASAHVAPRRAAAAVAVLSIASIALDSMAMRGYGGVFMVYSPRFATSVKRDVIDANPEARESVVFLAPEAQCSWTLLNGAFFRVYGGAYRPIYCETSVDSAVSAGRPGRLRVYGEGADGRLKELTSEYEQLRRSDRDASFDFIERFGEGRVANPHGIELDHEGGRILPWRSASGTDVVALTVISGFSYVYADVPVRTGEALTFNAGMVYSAAQPARAVVRVVAGGTAPQTVFSRVLQPPAEGAAASFQPFEVDLSRYAGQRVTIEFATETPGNNPTGHWIGYVKPRIVKLIAP